MSELLKEFYNPGVDCRGLSFWAWNARLSKDELIRQIHHFKKMGLGGFFMHARVGLATPYLSGEWFDCIRTCVSEAKTLGMKAWIYDEDRWPSGAAGGLVTKDDRHKEKKLTYEILNADDVSNGDGMTLAWYEASFDEEKQLIESHRIPGRNPDKTCLRFYWRCAIRSSWFNGETYLDTLNDESVMEFVNVTHEAYKREVGAEFAKTIPGFFTDEPCFTHFEASQGCLGWTTGFEEKFQRQFGYDICDHLPELFFAVKEECTQARWHYRKLMTDLFVKAFSKNIGEWCGENHIDLAGHVLAEDSLFGQTFYVGSAMRFYEYMQVPGIDLLTEHWNTYATTKQCSSAARQFGKPVRLCECYGCTGWDFPLAGHKALGDWLYALGINRRCMHLAWYSMAGEAKRDYPASISYQSPWSCIYSSVEDYFARLGAVLTGGEEKRDILLLHAVESYWSMAYQTAQSGADGSPAMMELDDKFTHVYNRLLAENLDFDFGDEDILARLAYAENGILHVGKADYRTIVLPVLKTIRSSTLNVLEQFVKSGGTVFAIGDAPTRVDAVSSSQAIKAYRSFVQVSMEDFTDALSRNYRIVSLTMPDGRQAEPLLFRLACKNGEWTCFICNTSNTCSDSFFDVPTILNRTAAFPKIDVTIAIPEAGSVYELNPSNDDIIRKTFRYENGRYCFETSFAQLESRLFIITRDVAEGQGETGVESDDVLDITLPFKDLEYCLSEDNVLILDHAAYSFNGKTIASPEYILGIDEKVRMALGAQRRGGKMIQPWLLSRQEDEKSIQLRLEYSFVCDSIPETCRLAMEYPEHYSIYLNGTELKPVSDGYWVDVSLKTLPIPVSMLREGENHLVLECTYQASQPGLEAIFLLGRFGVYKDVIRSLPTRLHLGDVCAQGLPYYAGNITYQCPLPAFERPAKRVRLSLPPWRGTALGIRVNHGKERILAWPPYNLEIAPELHFDGKDEVEITVYGHRRNAFGPFYDTEVSPVWCGSNCFYAQEVSERHLVPLGLLED